MYWIHGKAQFTQDKKPKMYTRYGPFSEITVARYALIHILETKKKFGGIELSYSISQKRT